LKKKKYFWGFLLGFSACFPNFGSFGHCRIQLLTEKLSFIISHQLRAKKKNHFLILAVFSSFSDFEIEVLHREVDGGFAEMKVCRVAHRNCFLHSFLSEKNNEKYGI
jgi:hypothetical protein